MIDNKFNLLDKVKIPELELEGIVTTIWAVEKGITYNVRYFWEGKVHEAYFYDWELELIKKG